MDTDFGKRNTRTQEIRYSRIRRRRVLPQRALRTRRIFNHRLTLIITDSILGKIKQQELLNADFADCTDLRKEFYHREHREHEEYLITD